MTQHWLMKTEPATYSFEQLLKDGETPWNGVRNFQARNYLQKVSVRDQVLIYHSGDERAVRGIAVVSKGPYADPDPKKKGDWVQVNLKPVRSLKKTVALAELKANAKVKGLALLKQGRLSVMPVSEAEFKEILRMSGE